MAGAPGADENVDFQVFLVAAEAGREHRGIKRHA
jgi:hypothetical protein